MNATTPIRDLPGRQLIQSLQRLSWRFETLRQDYGDLMEIEEPTLAADERTHRFQHRGQLYEAERRLHHFLAGYYTYTEVVKTVADDSIEASGRDAVYGRLGNYHDDELAKEIMGLRIFVQHNDILPLLVRHSEHSGQTPVFALNKDELHIDEGYRRGFNHHYGHIDETCIYPFESIDEQWSEIESLHDYVVDNIKQHNHEHIEEYMSRLTEIREIRDEHVIPELQDMLDINVTE